jgi:hypothetical protein
VADAGAASGSSARGANQTSSSVIGSGVVSAIDRHRRQSVSQQIIQDRRVADQLHLDEMLATSLATSDISYEAVVGGGAGASGAAGRGAAPHQQRERSGAVSHTARARPSSVALPPQTDVQKGQANLRGKLLAYGLKERTIVGDGTQT